MTISAARLSRLVVLPLRMFLASCQAANAKPAAEAQIVPFHDRYDARQFGMVYDSTDAGLKAHTPQEEFLKFDEGMHQNSGASRRPSRRLSTSTWKTGGTVVTLTYETTFERAKRWKPFSTGVRGK
jgi:hypothetical protein